MTKAERRARIKHIYPLACAGNLSAIHELARLLTPPRRRARCSFFGCRRPIWTILPHGTPARCKIHDRRNLSMKPSLALL